MKKRILVVDDQALILFSLAELLESSSVEVVTASTALKALEAVTAFSRYDLCIIDLSLPDMNGIELIQEIRNISPDSRFIVMTGKYYNEIDLIENIKGASNIGPFRLITKPFDLSETQETICQILIEEDTD